MMLAHPSANTRQQCPSLLTLTVLKLFQNPIRTCMQLEKGCCSLCPPVAAHKCSSQPLLVLYKPPSCLSLLIWQQQSSRPTIYGIPKQLQKPPLHAVLCCKLSKAKQIGPGMCVPSAPTHNDMPGVHGSAPSTTTWPSLLVQCQSLQSFFC